METKKNKRVIVLVVVFSLLITGMGGCSVADRFLRGSEIYNDFFEGDNDVAMPDDSYLGIWYINKNDSSKELSIMTISQETLTFNLGIEKLASIDATAQIEGNSIVFTGQDPAGNNLYGTLIFDDRTIMLSIDQADWIYDLEMTVKFTHQKGVETDVDDTSQDYIYNADYSYDVPYNSYATESGDVYYVKDIIVPYINLDSVDARKANSEIKAIFNEAIMLYKEGLNDKQTYVDPCNYTSFITEDVLSVYLMYGAGGTDVVHPAYYTYSFNLKTGRLLTYEDVCQIAGFDADVIDEKVEAAIKYYMINTLQFNKTRYIDSSINNYRSSVAENNVKYFLDSDKKLNVLVTLNLPAGNGAFDAFITVLYEEENLLDDDDA